MSARHVKYVKVYCTQYGEPFTAIWFNQPYVLGKLKEDAEYLFLRPRAIKFGR